MFACSGRSRASGCQPAGQSAFSEPVSQKCVATTRSMPHFGHHWGIYQTPPQQVEFSETAIGLISLHRHLLTSHVETFKFLNIIPRMDNLRIFENQHKLFHKLETQVTSNSYMTVIYKLRPCWALTISIMLHYKAKPQQTLKMNMALCCKLQPRESFKIKTHIHKLKPCKAFKTNMTRKPT